MNDSVIEITGLLRTDFEWPQTGPTIEGTNIVELVARRFGRSMSLTVTVGSHVIGNGPIDKIEPGERGYSELTDYILDRMIVGDIDLLGQLQTFNNQIVTLRVDQGPMTSRRHSWGTRSLSFAEFLDPGNLGGEGYSPFGMGPSFSYDANQYASENLVDRLFKTFLPDDNGDYARLTVFIDGKEIASGETKLTRYRAHPEDDVDQRNSSYSPRTEHPPVSVDSFVVGGIDILARFKPSAEYHRCWVNMEVNDRLELDS